MKIQKTRNATFLILILAVAAANQGSLYGQEIQNDNGTESKKAGIPEVSYSPKKVDKWTIPISSAGAWCLRKSEFVIVKFTVASSEVKVEYRSFFLNGLLAGEGVTKSQLRVGDAVLIGDERFKIVELEGGGYGLSLPAAWDIAFIPLRDFESIEVSNKSVDAKGNKDK